MRHSKWLIPLALAATPVFFACSGGSSSDDDDDGGSGQYEGAYTVTYTRVSANSNCGSEDPDWIQGILVIEQSGSSIDLDFGTTYQISGDLDGDAFSFDQDLTDGTGLVHVAGDGAFQDSAGTLQIVGGPDSGIIADYANDCRVRGTYVGNRTTSSFGP